MSCFNGMGDNCWWIIILILLAGDNCVLNNLRGLVCGDNLWIIIALLLLCNGNSNCGCENDCTNNCNTNTCSCGCC